MRIGLITTLAGPGPLAGGVWRVVETHASALTAAGHEVHILAGWLGPIPDHSPIPNLSLIRLHKIFPGKNIRFLIARDLKRAIGEIESWADILHVHLCRDHVTTFAMHQLLRSRLPIVAQSHGMLGVPESQILRLFDAILARGVYRRPDSYFTLGSREVARLKAFGIPESKIHPVHNAVSEPPTFWRNPSGTPHFTFASRLHARKQPLMFVQAALSYLDSGRSGNFTIAGQDQGELVKIRELISGSSHSSNFDLPGSMDNSSVRELLTNSAAMILPSRNEPYPMIVLEALAAGTPVIVSNETGISSLLDSSKAARVIPPTKEHLVDALIDLGESQDLRKELSANGRGLFLDCWTEGSVAKVLVQKYEELCRN